MVLLALIIICIVGVALAMALRGKSAAAKKGYREEGLQNDIHWKLIFGLSLFMTFLCAVLGFTADLIPESLFLPIFVPWSSCVFILPALVIGKKVQFDRFLHGVITGLIGWTLGIVSTVFLMIVTLPYLHPHTASDWGQGVGIGAGMLWVFGMMTTPIMGLLASLSGRWLERKSL